MRESRIVRWLVPRVAVMRVDWPLVLLDAVVVVLAYVGMTFLRFDGRVPPALARSLADALPVLAMIHVGANALSGLYGRVWRQASVEEARRVLASGALASVIVVVLVSQRVLGLSMIAAVAGGGLSVLLVGCARFQARVFSFHRTAVAAAEGERAVLVGAGTAARTLLHSLREHPEVGITPVAVVDDDPRTWGRSLVDIPITGAPAVLPAVLAETRATMLIVAAPDASAETVADAADVARAADVRLQVLPTWSELVHGRAGVHDLRDVQITDLLGRRQIATDLTDVRDMIAGRTVLITGGGGSIGSEIARQVAAFDPAALVLLDHDETHLHDALDDLPPDTVQVLADIRDRRCIDRVFARWRPELVFHAAAHKHVPVLEHHPCEAIATNVLGSRNVIRAAVDNDVSRLVQISTDKAVDPVNVMGATKRIGEQLMLTARPEGAAFAVVRFGNVLGSRGSVVPAFIKQIRRGGPLTVTHPDVERFFMSIPEAVHLVLHAAAQSRGGDTFMLDMGRPVRIMDLAKRMRELAGQPHVPIEITGLRPGEKLTEELKEPDEERTPTSHPSVHRLRPRMVDRDLLDAAVHELRETVEQQDDERATRMIFDLVERVRAPDVDHLIDLVGGVVRTPR